MRTWLPIWLLFVVGCSVQRQATQVPEAPASPGWVQSRPTSHMYYVGIGVAPKTPGTDYRQTAKQNAISDLAGEIQVNVNTQSLLHTLETRTRFEQEFRESIRTRSNLDLSDYEPVDSWEDQNSYWVYYRLDKAAWADKQTERRRVARQLALDFLAKAEGERSRNRFSGAVDYYLRGLQAIESFWNEPNEVEYRGKTVLLGNELYAGLTDLLRRTAVRVENDLTLEYATQYETTAEVRATLLPNGEPLLDVPLKTTYSGTYGMVSGTYLTNADGRAEVPITDADRSGKENVFVVDVDLDPLLEPFRSDKFMRTLTASLEGASARHTITYRAPEVYVGGRELNLGKPMSHGPIVSAISTSLSRKGIRPSPDRDQADLVVNVEAATTKKGSAQGFKVAVLTVAITVREGRGNRIVYQTTKSDIKGLNVKYEAAGLSAYENYTKNIESQLMRQLVTDFL